MITNAFNPDSLVGQQMTFWADWSARAKDASKRTIRAWEAWWKDPNRSKKPPSIPDDDQDIWKELRDWLLEHYFHQKCAYCERKIVKETGDTEHFRPKGRVTYKVEGRKTPKVAEGDGPNGDRMRHPGYFWLTHHWRNLLPSCKGCNALKGKLTQYPTREDEHTFLVKLTRTQVADLNAPPVESESWPGYYYLDPSDLDEREDPLLLHPYRDDPRQHLRFLEGGVATPRVDGDVDKAVESIKVFDLNHDQQRVHRQKAQETAVSRYLHKAADFRADGFLLTDSYRKAYESLAASITDETEYSAAARDMVDAIPGVAQAIEGASGPT